MGCSVTTRLHVQIQFLNDKQHLFQPSKLGDPRLQMCTLDIAIKP